MKLAEDSPRHPAPHVTPSLSWALRLRWLLLAAQLAVAALARSVFGERMPLGPVAAVLGAGLVSNVLLLRWRSRDASEVVFAAVLGFDVLLLSILLLLTGGAFNPFSVLYLVPIAIAPVVLSPRWTWALIVWTAGCYALLFGEAQLLARALRVETISHADQMRIHVRGMWIAFVVAAAFIGSFIGRLQAARADDERELARMRKEQERDAKLAALATLAAGAAHELATPLSTIAVVAKELERRLSELGDEEAKADAALVREQVDRCRAVLAQMAADAGNPQGEMSRSVTLAELLADAQRGLPASPAIRWNGEPPAEQLHTWGPPRSLSMALRGLLKNAQQAQEGHAGQVEVRTFRVEDRVGIEVVDHGEGMTADVLARAGEPFFTTKEPGKGMGLGLFLARSLLERCGGSLEVRSENLRGTTVSVQLPNARGAVG